MVNTFGPTQDSNGYNDQSLNNYNAQNQAESNFTDRFEANQNEYGQHGSGVNRSYDLTRQETYDGEFPDVGNFSEQNAYDLTNYNGSTDLTERKRIASEEWFHKNSYMIDVRFDKRRMSG